MLNLKTVSGRLKELFRGREQTAPVNRAAPGSRNLLVVDDEESICFSMSEYFSQHGFKVDTARELEEAEKLIKTGRGPARHDLGDSELAAWTTVCRVILNLHETISVY